MTKNDIKAYLKRRIQDLEKSTADSYKIGGAYGCQNASITEYAREELKVVLEFLK